MREVYKKDSKGKIRVYKTYTEGGTLIQETGTLNGKMVKNEVECKGKNIGRANETTPDQQALLEMESRIKKKIDKGYFETVTQAEEEVVMLPMLAKDYKKEFKKVKYPCYIQPKLDGMRALGTNGLTSRAGKVIDNMMHIVDDISHLDSVIDGELYAHGLTFQENMKLIKKYREGESETVKYHVYDLVSEDTFIKRYNNLKMIVAGIPTVEVVETYEIMNETELKEYHSKFIEEGYEGSIVRWGSVGYKLNGRSSNLLKYKDFIDEAYEVVDIIASDRRPTEGIVVCKLGAHTFKATPKMSRKEKEELLTNKDNYIGQTAEVRFFEFTDDGIPRFPVCVGFRLDK